MYKYTNKTSHKTVGQNYVVGPYAITTEEPKDLIIEQNTETTAGYKLGCAIDKYSLNAFKEHNTFLEAPKHCTNLISRIAIC